MLWTSAGKILGVVLVALTLFGGGFAFGYRVADNAAEVARLQLANKVAGEQLSRALTRIVEAREEAEKNAKTAEWLQEQSNTDAKIRQQMQETIDGLAQVKEPACQWPPDVLSRLQQLRAQSPGGNGKAGVTSRP